MTSREDLGRLAHAAYCDMAGRPAVWEMLGPRAQAAWMHAATTVRDRLQLGMSHAYRPEDQRQEESAMTLPRSTAHGGSEAPHITATDDAELYRAERAAGNRDVQWSGEGPAPDITATVGGGEASTDDAAARQDSEAGAPAAAGQAKSATRRGGSKR